MRELIVRDERVRQDQYMDADNFIARRNWGPNIKAELSSFSGDLEVEDFLDWVSEVDKYFELMDIPEERQIKYLAFKLRGGANAWWEQYQSNKRREGQPVQSWRQMRTAMMHRFLPAAHEQLLFQKLQGCRQGERRVQEYTNEFYRLVARNDLTESEGQRTMRYIGGLSPAIRDRVEMHTVYNVDEAVNQAVKAETQLERRIEEKRNASPIKHNVSPPRYRENNIMQDKQHKGAPQNKAENPYVKQYGDKCFRCQGFGHRSNVCPSRRVNLAEKTDDNEVMETYYIGPEDALKSDDEDTPRRACVVRKWSLATAKVFDDITRHGLFQTSCKIGDYVAEILIDGGSESNIISRQLIKKLKLPTQRHPTPYTMGWINSMGDMKVTEQCAIDFAIGKYQDRATFDVVDMDVCQVVLGRPWQIDVDACHKGRTNTYEFVKDKVKYVLSPRVSQCVVGAPKKTIVSVCKKSSLSWSKYERSGYEKRKGSKLYTSMPRISRDSRSSLFQERATDVGRFSKWA